MKAGWEEVELVKHVRFIDYRGVRRQGFWNQWQLKLREYLAHLVGCIMRHAGGDASVALRTSY
ncbi:hypothetical protein KMP13_08980, partial [Epibacterium ulvae]|uniref:hypothetical protein n=1 Tax=Epibacterium ulvae TaxID=1156985 RepID=UPI001BFCB2C3